MSAQRKKRGRPPFKWHGPRGDEFVRAVHDTWQKGRRKSIANAIHVVVRQQHKFPDLERHSDRFLQKQYLKAKRFWLRTRVQITEIKKPSGKAELVEHFFDLVEH